MTARKATPLAEKRRQAREQRERDNRASQVGSLKVSEDIDPAELLKASKVIIHTEVKRMAELQARGEPITPNDAKKLMQMISTINQMLTISDRTKPDLTALSDEELARLAEGGQ